MQNQIRAESLTRHKQSDLIYGLLCLLFKNMCHAITVKILSSESLYIFFFIQGKGETPFWPYNSYPSAFSVLKNIHMEIYKKGHTSMCVNTDTDTDTDIDTDIYTQVH